MRATRRCVAVIALIAVGAALAAGCGGGADGPRWDARSISASQEGAGVTPALVNSNVGVGQTRLAFGFFRADGSLLDSAEVTAHLFRLADEPENRPTVAETAGDLQLRPVSLPLGLDHIHPDGGVHKHVSATATMYVGTTTLDRSGWWGATIDIANGDLTVSDMQLRFFVQEHTPEPAVGDPAPATKQATIADVPLSDLDSTYPPNPQLHDRTIAVALSEGRPLVVAFATPAFCQTQFCGPVMESVVIPAWHQFGDRVGFIHVEPWDLKQAREGSFVPTDAFIEWGLVSEPFVFVIDADGTIAAKFEGIVGVEELDAAIEDALARAETAAD